MAAAAVAGSAIVSAAPRAFADSDGDLAAEAGHGLPLTVLNNSGEFANRSIHLGTPFLPN